MRTLTVLLSLGVAAFVNAQRPLVPESTGAFKKGSRGPVGASFSSDTDLAAKKNGGSESNGRVASQNSVVAKADNRRAGDGTMVAGAKDRNAAGHFLGKGKKSGFGNIVVQDEDAWGRKGRNSGEKKSLANNIKALNVRGQGGQSAVATNDVNGDNNNFNLVGRSKSGRLVRGKADTNGCNGANPFSDCRQGNFESNAVDASINPDQSKNGQNGEFQGKVRFDNKKGRAEDHAYTVLCKPSRRDRNKCDGAPVTLENVRGEKYECTTEEITNAYSKTTCCNYRRRCVASKTNADGDVTIERAGTQVGDGDCQTEGLASRRPDGLIARKVNCNAGVRSTKADKSGANAQNLKATTGPGCYAYREDGKEIKIDNARYVADSKTTRDGTTFDFPSCGTMTADVNFVGFSSAELKDFGPRLAMQTIVNVSPAGQLKCIDDAVCIAASERGDPADSNCYYCDLCNKERHKDGILGKAESESVCDEDMSSRKRTLSARICPMDENDKQTFCTLMSKTATDPYWQKKGDVDVKFLLYLRREAPADGQSYLDWAAEQYRKEKSKCGIFGSICWAGQKRLILAKAKAAGGASAVLDLLNGGGSRTTEDEDFKVFLAYLQTENPKGQLLSCQTFVGDWSIFGNNLGKITDVASSATDINGLLGRGAKAAECKKFLDEQRQQQFGSLDLGRRRL